MPLPNLNFEMSDVLDATGHRLVIRGVPDGLPRPLWSVMIPMFHCARFLRQTLESVLSQDPGPDQMQIEVVDDCSNDNTASEVTRRLGAGRIEALHLCHNRHIIRRVFSFLVLWLRIAGSRLKRWMKSKLNTSGQSEASK